MLSFSLLIDRIKKKIVFRSGEKYSSQVSVVKLMQAGASVVHEKWQVFVTLREQSKL